MRDLLAIVLGKLTSSIDSIVDPAKLLDGFQHELVDLLGAGDVCLHD